MDESIHVQEFTRIFSAAFDLYPQVCMRHPLAGNDLKIDFIGFDKENYMLGPVGFEIKDPARWDGTNGSFGGFTDALAQCIDYQARIINTRFSNPEHNRWFYQRPRYTFLYPVDSTWGYDFEGSQEVPAMRGGGALRLAGKFGVGAACNTQYGWILTLGAAKAFSLQHGPSDLFTRHAVASRVGSAR